LTIFELLSHDNPSAHSISGDGRDIFTVSEKIRM